MSNPNIQELRKMRIKGSRPVWDRESKMSSDVRGNELFTVQYREICGAQKQDSSFAVLQSL